MIGHSFPTLEEKPYIPTMPKNRIIPTVAIVPLLPLGWAQSRPDARPCRGPRAGGVDDAHPGPDRGREDARRRHQKVSAIELGLGRVIQTVECSSQRFDDQRHVSQGPRNRFYLELTVVGLPDVAG